MLANIALLAQEAAGVTDTGIAALTYGLGAIGPGIGIGYLVGQSVRSRRLHRRRRQPRALTADVHHLRPVPVPDLVTSGEGNRQCLPTSPCWPRRPPASPTPGSPRSPMASVPSAPASASATSWASRS